MVHVLHMSDEYRSDAGAAAGYSFSLSNAQHRPLARRKNGREKTNEMRATSSRIPVYSKYFLEYFLVGTQILFSV